MNGFVDGNYAGSQAVRALLEEGRFGSGLFDHIHESYLVNALGGLAGLPRRGVVQRASEDACRYDG